MEYRTQVGRKKPDAGIRVNIWVPADRVWIIEWIDQVVADTEMRTRIPHSRSKEILDGLTKLAQTKQKACAETIARMYNDHKDTPGAMSANTFIQQGLRDSLEAMVCHGLINSYNLRTGEIT